MAPVGLLAVEPGALVRLELRVAADRSSVPLPAGADPETTVYVSNQSILAWTARR